MVLQENLHWKIQLHGPSCLWSLPARADVARLWPEQRLEEWRAPATNGRSPGPVSQGAAQVSTVLRFRDGAACHVLSMLHVVLQVQTPVTWPATRIMRNCAAQRGCCWPWCSLVVIMLKVESNGLNVSTKTDLAPPAACSAACSSWKWGKSLNFLTH